MAAEEAARVDLQWPAALCELVREAGVCEHGLRALGVRHDRRQARALDPLSDLEEEMRGAQERNLDEHVLRLLEHVSPRILVQERRHRRQLVTEPELGWRLFAKLHEGLPDPPFALLGQR